MDNIANRSIDMYTIKQRKKDGYIDGISLCKVESRDLKEFLNLSSTKEFITELSISTSLSQSELIRDNWLHPQLSLYLGCWLSPKITITVFEWIKQWLLNDFPKEQELSSFNKSLKQALEFTKDKG